MEGPRNLSLARALLGAGLLVSAASSCSAPPSEPNNAPGIHVEYAGFHTCGPEGNPRPFGRRFKDFGTVLADTAKGIGNDVVDGTAQTGRNISEYGDQLSRDFGASAQNLVGAIPGLAVDAQYHWYGLERDLSYGLRRAKHDLLCFPSRAWYDLKILE